MCYNCQCMSKDEDMGHGKVRSGGGSLTESYLQYMADAWGMTLKETKKNIYEMLMQEFKEEL